MSKELFPPLNPPRIYAYEDSRFKGCLKVGYTTKSAQDRVAAQYPVLLPNQSYRIILDEIAVRDDASFFTDHDVHKVLSRKKIKRLEGEWFECDINDVLAALIEVKTGKRTEEGRILNFCMRPEQEAAVNKTISYFKSFKAERPNKTPHFLWNAKMRFGKTFATYQLAKKLGWKKILILTFKPAVQNAWQEDLESHLDFNGWQFISRDGVGMSDVDPKKPIACFGSFQDFLGKNSAGGIKSRNEWVHTTNWDCVIFDEYHYGAWRDTAKELFEAEDKDEIGEGLEYFAEENMPITTNSYLYLSGTPFRAISSGEFIEEQIYNWTYSDEQRAKETWDVENPDKPNPYASLPRMVMLTYQLPDSIRDVAMKGEFNEFDLNQFFTAEGEGHLAKFKYEN